MPQFDPQRFEALVLYIAERTREDSAFGRTKLAKVLFYADFVAYRDEGHSLTGATYIRMPFGPFPEVLDATERQLAAAGKARLEHEVEDYEEKRIVALGPADEARRLFEPWQLHLVDDWIREVSEATARRISELSHEHPGWILAHDTGAVIPYVAAYAPNHPPPDEAVTLGRRLAREHEWP